MLHLVSMPFGSITIPVLALGLFDAQLTQAGLPHRLHHFSFDFARRIGLGAYGMIALFKGVETQIGEWLFAREAWGRGFGPSEDCFLELCGDELSGIPHVRDTAAWLRQVRNEVVSEFLDDAVDRIAATGVPEVVGFSCTFFQTVASLALGRRLRMRFPQVKLVYGGACFHGEMGRELLRAADWIDSVSVGEADDVIVPLLSALSEGRPPEGLQGVLWRTVPEGPIRQGPPPRPVGVGVLNALPAPSFDSFFEDAGRIGLKGESEWFKRVMLPFESARGCWWGEKQHCTFCGLNGEGMAYRSKSADRVYETLVALRQRYPRFKRFQAADNILDMHYFQDLLPRLKAEPLGDGVEIFWSVKANLRASQIRALAEAGVVYVQPGIESLSDNLLKRMRKGVTALQNIFLMKTCRALGVTVGWNNLIRIPGEVAEDYAKMVDWIPLLVHLRPPFGGTPKVECHRFSPYFVESGRWTENVRPMRWYAGLFPEDQVDLSRVAYYFEGDWKDVLDGNAYDDLRRVSGVWSRIWREDPVLPVCAIEPRVDGGLDILDTRSGSEIRWHLNAEESEVYRWIEEPCSVARLSTLVASATTGAPYPQQLGTILDSFVTRGLAVEADGTYLALALTEGSPAEPLALRSRNLRRLTNQSLTVTRTEN